MEGVVYTMKLKKTLLNSQIKAYYPNELDYNLAKITTALFANDYMESQIAGLERVKLNEKYRVYRFQYGGEVYYLKKYVSPTVNYRIKNAIRLSKAVGSMRKALQLKASGLEVAEPVAAFTYQKNIFRKESIYVAKNYPGITMLEFLNSDAASESKKQALLEFAAVYGRFYKCGFYHIDPFPTNFMVQERNGQYAFGFIDLEAIRHFPRALDIATFKSLQHIHRYFMEGLFEGNKWIVSDKAEIQLLLKSFLSVYKPFVGFSKVMRHLRC
jgi:hypothetical protein